MALEGATIVSQHILDDTGLREGLMRNETMIRSSADRMAGAFRDASGRFVSGAKVLAGTTDYMAQSISSAGEASVAASGRVVGLANGVRTLSSSLHLVTGETGFMAVEMARAGTHITSLVANVGGLGAAIRAVGVAMMSNPVTLVLVALATLGAKVYSIWNATSEAIKKANESMAEGLKKEAANAESAFKTLRGLQDELDNLNDPSEARTRSRRRMAIIREIGPGANTGELATGREAAEFELAAKKKAIAAGESLNKRIADENAFYVNRANLEHEATIKAADDRANAYMESEQKVHDFQVQLDERRLELQKNTLQSLAIEYGGAKPSDFITDPKLKAMALFGEDATARRKIAGEDKGGGFGISSQAASGFRFGAGAMGSVIGEQSEQKNTTQAIKDLEKGEEKRFNAFMAKYEATFGNITPLPKKVMAP